MKIAICGSAGTGKSTLAHALAESLEARWIAEGYDRLFDAPGRVIRPRERLMRLVEQLVRDKHSAESSAAKSVSDRCPVDAFNLWLSWGFSRDQRATERFYRLCRESVRHFDLVVVLPYGALPLRQREQAGDPRRRQMNPWIQFHNHAAIVGIARQWVRPEKLLPIPVAVRDLQTRINAIRDRAGASSQNGKV